MNVNLQDSGQRVESPTGMQTDPGNSEIALELLSPYALFDLAVHMGRGAKKYKSRNWEKGGQFSIAVGKLLRHALKFVAGKTDEDHLSAVGFWWHALAHYRHEIAAGRLPASLDDMPKYDRPATFKIDYPFATTKSATFTQDGDLTPAAMAAQQQYKYEQEYLKAQGYDIGVDHAEPGGDHAVECVGSATEYPRPTLYIAGPMRGKPRLNWDAFFEAEKQLQDAGYHTINPARLDMERGIDPDTFDIDLTQDILRDTVGVDLSEIIKLDPAWGDGIALLDGWETSVGACAERATACWLRLAINSVDHWCDPAFDYYCDRPIKPKGYCGENI